MKVQPPFERCKPAAGMLYLARKVGEKSEKRLDGRPLHMNARKQIIEAIFELLNKYPMEKITVDMIVEQCEMSRTSFYRYFQDKDQLMTMAYTFYVDKMVEGDLMIRDWAAVHENILRLMLDNKTAFENMFIIEGQDSFFKFLYASNLRMLRENYMRIKEISKLTLYETHLMELYIAGMVWLEQQWVQRGMDLPPKEMARIITGGMPTIIKSAFTDPPVT